MILQGLNRTMVSNWVAETGLSTLSNVLFTTTELCLVDKSKDTGIKNPCIVPRKGSKSRQESFIVCEALHLAVLCALVLIDLKDVLLKYSSRGWCRLMFERREDMTG